MSNKSIKQSNCSEQINEQKSNTMIFCKEVKVKGAKMHFKMCDQPYEKLMSQTKNYSENTD